MSNSNILHQHLARAGAPTSGLVHSMSTTTTSLAAVKTTARVASTSTKVQATSTAVAGKPSTSSQVRAVTSSSVAPVKPSTSSTPPVLKTITPETTSSVLPLTTSTTSTSSTPTTSPTLKATTTSTSSRISTSTVQSSSSTRSSSSISTTSSSSSTIDILASASASSTSVATKSTSGISGGAMAGIIIGVLVALIGAALVAYRLIQRRRRANRRLTGNLQAWTDRTSYFSASGAGRRGEREVEGGEVPFRDAGDKDGGPWGMEEKGYEEPVLAGVGAGLAAGSGYAQHDQHQQAYQAYEQQQAYAAEYQQPQHQGYQSEYQQPQQFYQPYAQQQAYNRDLMPHTPTHQTQPQGYPYTPSASAQSPDGYNTVPSPVPSSAAVPAPVVPSGPALQDGMTVIVRQGFVRTLEDELVIAPNDTLTVLQAYDDGWCLCQSALNEQGVVPQSCLEPVSPFSEEGRTSPIQMPVPAVVVSDERDEVLAGEEEKGLPSLPRSDTRKSLAVSERSERRSSLFLNAAAAGLFLQQQAAMQPPLPQ